MKGGDAWQKKRGCQMGNPVIHMPNACFITMIPTKTEPGGEDKITLSDIWEA
jgi:hypothetical protein